MKPLILIGMPGAGKSSVGKRLALAYNRVLYDTDEQLEEQFQKSIRAFFQEKGEVAFREEESICFEKLLYESSGASVISTGGGIVLMEKNRALLQEKGRSIYLKANIDTIHGRLQQDKSRPLLLGDNLIEKLEQMLSEREHFYQQSAHHIIEVDKLSPEEVVQKIMNQISLSC